MSGLAALLWIKLPGGSDGICGGETAYLFSPTQARRLTMNSPFVPADGRRLARPPTFRQPGTDTTEPDRSGSVPPDVDQPTCGTPLTGGPPKPSVICSDAVARLA